MSRWFADTFSKSANIQPDPSGRRKVWHSFRSTAITAALNNYGRIPHIQQVVGHEKSVLGETATYMGEFPVATLVPVVEALDWGLDHSAYAKTWRDYVAAWPDAAASPATQPVRASARVKRAA